MALKIRWTKRAKSNFNKILQYLELEYGENITSSFAIRAYGIIENLSEFPKMGSIEVKTKKIRGFLITKHNRMFYRFTKDELIILNFFDTRQNPKKKKY